MSETVYANRQVYSYKGVTLIDFAFSVGASGAPTLITTGGASNGVYGVSRSASGRYALFVTFLNRTRNDKYVRCLDVHGTIEYSGTLTVFPSIQLDIANLGLASSYVRIGVVAPSVSTGPALTTAFTDPPNGSVIRGTIYMKRGKAT